MDGWMDGWVGGWLGGWMGLGWMEWWMDGYLSYCIQTWHDGRLMDALYAHAHFEDLDLDAWSHSGSAKAKNQLCMLSATKQAICIKLATTVGHFLCDLDLDFANVCMVCPTCFLSQGQEKGSGVWSGGVAVVGGSQS